MSVLTFTQLAPHARMNAVTSLRDKQDRDLAYASKVLDECRKMTLLAREEQPANLDEMLARADKVRNNMLRRAGALEDDIYCIEFLRNDKQSFNDRGELLDI